MPGQGPTVPVPVSKKHGGVARISKKVRDAITLMVFHGKSRADAAKAVELKEDSLYRAMRKPEVLSFRARLMADKKGEEASRSLERVARLADQSDSDHVRLEASKFLLGLDGHKPVEKHQHHHVHEITPGYVLDMSGPDLAKPEWARDVTQAADDGPVIENEGGEEPART